MSLLSGTSFLDGWDNMPNKRTYYKFLGAGALFLLSGLLLTVDYVPKFETREGFVPPDPFMAFLPATDVSTFIFFILYASIILAFFFFLQDPEMLLAALLSFGFMYWFRAFCITMIPFNEPSGLIVLSDPFIAKLGVYQKFVRRDLFFSGHFASVFMLWLLLRRYFYSHFLLLGSIAMGILVMVQRIHYSYDVAGAVAFSYISVYCANKMISLFLHQHPTHAASPAAAHPPQLVNLPVTSRNRNEYSPNGPFERE